GNARGRLATESVGFAFFVVCRETLAAQCRVSNCKKAAELARSPISNRRGDSQRALPIGECPTRRRAVRAVECPMSRESDSAAEWSQHAGGALEATVNQQYEQRHARAARAARATRAARQRTSSST